MFDDQTTSRWIPRNGLGLPVRDAEDGPHRSAAAPRPWPAEPDPVAEPSQDVSSWELAAEIARLQRAPTLPLWVRTLVPAVALFAATLFGSVVLFLQPSASRSSPPPAARASTAVEHLPAPAPTPPTPAREPDRPAAESRTAAAGDGSGRAERAGSGRLRLNSRPWSHVFVDGRPVGHTPLLGLPLPAGEHEIELVNEAIGVRKKLRVNIRQRETVTKVVLLVD